MLQPGLFDLFGHGHHDGNGKRQSQQVSHRLNGGHTVGAQKPCHGIDDGDEAGTLPGGCQNEGTLGIAQAGAEHIDNGDPRVDGQGDALQNDAQRADLLHFGVFAGEDGDQGLGENNEDGSHGRRADESDLGGEAVALFHTVKPFGAPVEAGHRLEAAAEAQDDAEGEHHDLGADADARQNGVGNVARQIVEHDGGNHRKTAAEHGGRTHGNHVVNDVLAVADVLDGQVEHTPLGDIGEQENSEADHLGDHCRQRRAGNAHIQTEDEDGVQGAVEDTAEAHADHGKRGAALTSQALVHDKAGSHKGSGEEDVGGVVNGILLTGGGGTQQANHGSHKNGAEDHQQSADAEGGEEGGGKDLTGLFVVALAHQPGHVAVGTQSQQRAAHHDQLVKGGVDTDGGGGVGTQGADEVGIRQRVNGVNKEGDDGGDGHFGNDPVNGHREHHQSAGFLPLIAFVIHSMYPFCMPVAGGFHRFFYYTPNYSRMQLFPCPLFHKKKSPPGSWLRLPPNLVGGGALDAPKPAVCRPAG